MKVLTPPPDPQAPIPASIPASIRPGSGLDRLQRMTPDAEICLKKTWPLIVRLALEIAGLVAGPAALTPSAHCKALRLLRLAEGLMRRWLVLSACARPLPDPAPGRAPGRFPGPLPRQSKGPHLPRFRLVDPVLKAAAAPRAAILPFRIIAFQPDPLVPAFCLPSAGPEPADPAPAALRLKGRAQALLGAVRTPQKQIARMRRCLARGLTGLGPFPLRLQRPWGQSRRERRRRPEAYAALRDLRVFTRDALIAQIGPD